MTVQIASEGSGVPRRVSGVLPSGQKVEMTIPSLTFRTVAAFEKAVNATAQEIVIAAAEDLDEKDEAKQVNLSAAVISCGEVFVKYVAALTVSEKTPVGEEVDGKREMKWKVLHDGAPTAEQFARLLAADQFNLDILCRMVTKWPGDWGALNELEKL